MSANQKQQCELSDYAVQLIRYKARQLARTEGFTAQDLEDICQDLLVDLLERLPKFDPTRATYRTFVDRVVNHRIANLLRHRRREKRTPRREVCSLNEYLEDEEGQPIQRVEILLVEEADRRLGRKTRTDQEMAELALDVPAALQCLSDNLRRLCEFLKTGSITEASRAMGIPRATLQDHRKKLREFLEAVGLQDYLAYRPSSKAYTG